MGIARLVKRRQKTAIGVVMAFFFGTLLVFQVPAVANHGDTCLDVTPETATNPVGSTHTVTAQLRTVPPVGGIPGTPCSQYPAAATTGVIINFDIDGPGDVSVVEPIDQTCTTSVSGSCTMLYSSPQTAGTDTISGWIDDHAPRDEDETLTEGDAPSDPSESDEPDETDVVQKTWVGQAASSLDCDPETDTNPIGDAHTVTCTARDQFGNVSQGQLIDAEAVGVNDPDSTDSPTSPDWSCTTVSNGKCSFTHGPGGNGTTNTQGTTTYRAWVDTDNNDATTAEADLAETRAEVDSDRTDVVEKDWQSAPLNCSPEDDLNPTGTAHTITCSFRNASGQLTSGQRVHAEATGANDPDSGDTPAEPDFTCTTRTDNSATTEDETGTCTFTHGPGGTGSTNDAGTTTYRAWVDTDGNPSTFDGDVSEGLDENSQPGATPEGDRTDVVQKRWTASRLDCVPETDINPAGTSHTITCTALTEGQTATAGVEIDVEATGANDPDSGDTLATPDFTCITEQTTGRCSIVHGPGGVGTTNNGGTTTYRAWIDIDTDNSTTTGGDAIDTQETQVEGSDVDEPDNTDVVTKTWVASLLDCTPESDTNPAETAHTITCTATDSLGVGQASVNIDVEATGANDPDAGQSFTSPDFFCTTSVNGQCSFTHGPGGRGTTDDFGRTTYRAWIDADGSDATTEADPTEVRDESTTSPTPSPSPSPSPSSSTGAGTKAEPDDTDVVEKNWSAVPTTLSIDPETDSAPVGSCNTFLITATDAADAPVQHVVVDVEQRHTSSDNQTTNDEPTVSFCTPDETDGANPSDVDTTRGDLGTGTDGSLGGETEKTTDAEGKVTIGIRVEPSDGSDGTGDVLVTAFYENEDNDDPDSGEPQDSATKTWTPSLARTIDCGPEQASNQVDSDHTVTCTVRDTDGNPVEGEGVTFSEDGPGTFVGSTESNTDAEGHASATVTSDEAGTQTITGTLTAATAEATDDECDRAAGDPTGAAAGSCSDSVEKTWKLGEKVRSGPCRNFSEGSRTDRTNGGKVIVGTPGKDTLRGTSGNDIICGLGGRDVLIGEGGNDLLSGGGGNDTVRGNAGKDNARGDKGDDTLVGSGGNDVLKGGGGNDVLKGGDGNDTLRGSAGRDALRGNAGRDKLRGEAGDDNLDGGGGHDDLDGGGGTDTCASGGDELQACEP